MIIHLRADNTARVTDIVDLRKFIRWSNKHIDSNFQSLQTALEDAAYQRRLQDGQIRELATGLEELQEEVEEIMRLRGISLDDDETGETVQQPTSLESLHASGSSLVDSDGPGITSRETISTIRTNRTPPYPKLLPHEEAEMDEDEEVD